MKSLYVSHFGGLGGAERSLLELILAVRERGIDPVLLCPPGPLKDRAVESEVTTVCWDARPIRRAESLTGRAASLSQLATGWRKLDETIRRFRPDVIHANSAQAMLWNGPVGRLRGRKVIWHWRDFYDHRRTLKWLARWADGIIAISSAVEAFAADQLRNTSLPVVLIRNGIADLAPCDERQVTLLRRSIGLRQDVPLVVMAGQSIPTKGHSILIKALAELVAAGFDFDAWLLCAEHDHIASSHTRDLRKLADELGCGSKVRITGAIDDLGPALYAADVVCVPSMREPFGRIAVEAMLAQRPVIASAVDGLNEVVVHGETGLLVRPASPAILAENLIDMLAAPAAWRDKAQHARSRALQNFSVTRVAQEVVAMYGKFVCAN